MTSDLKMVLPREPTMLSIAPPALSKKQKLDENVTNSVALLNIVLPKDMNEPTSVFRLARSLMFWMWSCESRTVSISLDASDQRLIGSRFEVSEPDSPLVLQTLPEDADVQQWEPIFTTDENALAGDAVMPRNRARIPRVVMSRCPYWFSLHRYPRYLPTSRDVTWFSGWMH